MTDHIEIKVHPKEKLYFNLKVIAAVLGYGGIFFAISAAVSGGAERSMAFLPLLIYASLIGLYLFFSFGILIGYIQGNSVKVNAKQFPEVHNIVVRQSKQLGIDKVPDVYLMQNEGLNAFAARFSGTNYVVIFSEIFEEAYENNLATVEFVIGHELGHIKRKHMSKKLILFPSFFIPLLNRAYSRGCEFTCDNIGAALSPAGVRSGLLMLASGKKLWTKVNLQRFVEQEQTEFGFWFWFAEKFSTHPRLSKRVSRYKLVETASRPRFAEPAPVEKPASDHSAFLPKN
ncbi:MAG: M48 family metallopeptidase [Bacteroidota bacterium]